MMSKWSLWLGLALWISACASPRTPSPTATAMAEQSPVTVARGVQPENQQLVCRMVYPLSSHIPQRICLTAAQESARRKAARNAMQNLQMKGSQMQGTNGPP